MSAPHRVKIIPLCFLVGRGSFPFNTPRNFHRWDRPGPARFRRHISPPQRGKLEVSQYAREYGVPLRGKALRREVDLVAGTEQAVRTSIADESAHKGTQVRLGGMDHLCLW